MTDALEDSAHVVKHSGQQGPQIRSMHKFLEQVEADPDYARLLITRHYSPVSYNNPAGLFREGAFASDAQHEGYNCICEPSIHNDLCIE
eukprot:2146131-Rhodomonas_salina.1